MLWMLVEEVITSREVSLARSRRADAKIFVDTALVWITHLRSHRGRIGCEPSVRVERRGGCGEE